MVSQLILSQLLRKRSTVMGLRRISTAERNAMPLHTRESTEKLRF